MSRIHTLMLSAVASLFAVVSASAADLAPSYYKAPPPVAAPAWSWTGLYLGVHGGFGGDKFDYPFSAAGIPGRASLTSSGFFGGGQIGYNWQVSNWVLGLEADIAGSDIKSEAAAVVGPVSINAGSKLNWFGTVRGRLGYAVDRVMVYGTGGFAYGETETTASAAIAPIAVAAFSQTNSKQGWTAGAGIEYAMTNTITFKAEYLYLDLGTDVVFTSPAFTISEETKAHTVKAGVNWKFGGPGSMY